MPDSLQVLVASASGIPVLTLRGSLLFGGNFAVIYDTVTKLRHEGHDRLILDVAEVVYADSSGIGVLLHLRRTVASWNGRLILAGASERLRASLTVIGVVSMFEMAGDVGEAVRRLEDGGQA